MSRVHSTDPHCIKDAREGEMEVAVKERKTHRRSLAGHPTPAHVNVYQSETALSARSVSSASCKRYPRYQPDRPQQPSLSRVKGRSNMNTPPRLNTERSWLNDQSPRKAGAGTPPRQCRTPESSTPTLVNPASTLLQDLLKEQRAHRYSRGAAAEDWQDDGFQATEEGPPMPEEGASDKARNANDVFSAGVRQPKEMGIREMDQYVSKMNKLNFDLKLEIFHRAQQMATLEKKLERMQEMEEQLQRMQQLEEEVEELRVVEKRNLDLQQTNDQLSQELKVKTKAVAEAVEWICKLEAENEQLKAGGASRRTSQMSMGRLVLDGPNATTPKGQTMIEIPERTSSRRGQRMSTPGSSESRRLSQAPLFLRADNRSTSTLRSLYAPDNNHSHSAMSALTKSESFNTMSDTMEPESPRLSVLSECSELNPCDTPTKWNDVGQLELPVRKASSTTGSFDTYLSPTEGGESKQDQDDQWIESRSNNSETIIRRRQNRALSDASMTELAAIGYPLFGASSSGPLFAKKPSGRPRLDASLFGGARLPPTPDTMSTAYAAANNGSNGSIVGPKSLKLGQDPWFAGRPLDRHRSAGELTTPRSFNGSDITDSMQTNCSDTPRLETSKESPTFFPFNTVASKASELLGPGSPSNPIVDPFDDMLPLHNKENTVPSTVTPGQSPVKSIKSLPESQKRDASPPLTPQEWMMAAKQGPRSRKERAHGLRIHPRPTDRLSLYDNPSVDSLPTEAEVPGIPTLDLDTLDILEQPIAEALVNSQSRYKADPEPRRRISFRPPFFSRSNEPRRHQSSPVAHEFIDEEDGAPSPVIPKTRNMGGATGRPMSQIVTNSVDLYSSTFNSNDEDLSGSFVRPPTLHQSLVEARELSFPAQSGSATVAARPSTSHGVEHKRRSSLGIFGWMKGVSGKRAEPPIHATTDKIFESALKEKQLASAQPGYETAELALARASTPDAAPVVRPRSEMTVRSDEATRRPRYIGRRSRRG